MVGVLVGVTALIPVVGAFIGAGIGAFMILTESPVKALVFIIFIIVLQQIEGNLIYPKVMGSRVNLSGMWVLAAVTVGGGIAGPIGMLISVPIASTAYVLIKEATAKRERIKKQESKISAESEVEQ
jgi:predicted PurR-regulated permease PerM